MTEVLEVDLRSFESGGPADRAAVVDGVMRSLETGFVYARHGLPPDLLDEAYALLGTFFALPTETKARSHAPESHGQTGYTGLLVETAATAEVADWKEMLNWGREVPPSHHLRRRYAHQYAEQVLPEADVPGITAVLARFHDALADLQIRVLRIIAVGLGVDERFFDTMVRDGATLSRAIRYPAMQEAPGGGAGGHVWAAEHGDINLITALPRATAKGLQVKVVDDPDSPDDVRWVDAIPPDGYAVLNSGMMLDRLTNGRIPAGVHRVVADVDQPGERLSVVQFLHPTPPTILAPLSTCVTADRPQRWAPIEAGALLDQVLWEINLIEGAREAGGTPHE